MINHPPAEPTDVEAISSILTEVDRYYGATEEEPLAERVPQITSALFATPPSAYALLAWDDDQLIGIAAYSFLWPAAGVSRSLYLKELYVSEESRRHGIGQMLMSELCRIATESGCERFEWTADADNPIALKFYERIGVPPVSSKVFYRLIGETMVEMANSLRTSGANH
jgi:GNAT superfamily N-acetyltransferase